MSRKPARTDDPLAPADEAERALATLSLAARPIEPPQGLWAKIAAELPAEGGATARFDEGRWRNLAPGVEIKPLWGRRTFLIRCQPGATVPRHRHRSFEHTLILSGDIVAGSGEFGAGDYLGNPPGWHEAWSTRGGCVALIQYD
jgi:anti-sigma factor ChrR (cupin superfamily)